MEDLPENFPARMNAGEDLWKKCRTTNSCFDWHKYCKAECCKGYFVRVNHPESLKRGSILGIFPRLTPDLKHYYELHGAKVGHDQVKIKLEEFRIVGPDEIFVVARCKGLTLELACRFHGTPRQPKICSTPGPDTYRDVPDNVRITQNCLYKYKLEVEARELTEGNMVESDHKE